METYYEATYGVRTHKAGKGKRTKEVAVRGSRDIGRTTSTSRAGNASQARKLAKNLAQLPFP